jgi:hypothetical protein
MGLAAGSEGRAYGVWPDIAPNRRTAHWGQARPTSFIAASALANVVKDSAVEVETSFG